MKSKLQDGDVCELRNGASGQIVGTRIIHKGGGLHLSFYYKKNLTRMDGLSQYDIIRVTRNNEIIWQRGEPMDINKMATVLIDGQIYPLATHENMRILVDRISELEKEISNLKQGK